MENNRQFELMRSAARQKLEGADPVRLSVLTGLCWDGRTFDTETLGIPIRISWPECQISPANIAEKIFRTQYQRFGIERVFI